MQNNCNRENVTYAGFWVRLAAYIIDSVLVFFMLLFVRLFLLSIGALIEGTVLDGDILFQYSIKDIVLYLVEVLYFVLFTYGTGTTPGKKLMNLRVISADEGGKLKFFDVLYRETVGRFLSSITIGIGYFMAGVDREKRGLHDILCNTRVIYAKKVKVEVKVRAVTAPPVGAGTVPPTQAEPAMPEQMPLQNPDGAYHMVCPEDTTKERDS